jgi:lactate 2-monooxygenase
VKGLAISSPLPRGYLIAMLEDQDPGRTRQREIFLEGMGGLRPLVSTNGDRLQGQARRAMSAEGWAYVSGGAGLEHTLEANRAAFAKWQIVPRMLRDVTTRDLSVMLFGDRLRAPLLLAPVGVLEMAHKDADLAAARAAGALGVPMVFSSQASVAMEPCAAAMGQAPRWFQLYWGKSEDVVRSFLSRAEACGCKAIVLTVDTTSLGWRTRDMDLGYLPFLHGRGIAQYITDPAYRKLLEEPLPDAPAAPSMGFAGLAAWVRIFRKYPGGFMEKLKSGHPRKAVQRFIATFSRPSLTWDDVQRLRGMTRLPVVVKGIQNRDDAKRAVDAGANGLIVSNHGGRQVDGAIGSLDALPSVVEAIDGKVPVLFDSGIRGGADVFKALALGATAVLIGRLYAFGLAVAGEAGVKEVIQNVIAELDLTMGLAGCKTLGEITRDSLTPVPSPRRGEGGGTREAFPSPGRERGQG